MLYDIGLAGIGESIRKSTPLGFYDLNSLTSSCPASMQIVAPNHNLPITSQCCKGLVIRLCYGEISELLGCFGHTEWLSFVTTWSLSMGPFKGTVLRAHTSEPFKGGKGPY